MFSFPLALADDAATADTVGLMLAPALVDILLDPRMAVCAVGFQCAVASTQDIESACHRFQMVWIHTVCNTAEMIQL